MVFFGSALVLVVVVAHLSPRASANSEAQKLCEAPCDFIETVRLINTFIGTSRVYVKPFDQCFNARLDLGFGKLDSNMDNFYEHLIFNYTVTDESGKLVDVAPYTMSKTAGCITNKDGRNSIPYTPKGCAPGTGGFGIICNKENNGLDRLHILKGPWGDITDECYAAMSEELKKLGVEDDEDIKKCIL